MADTKLADYKTELLNLVAQVRSAGRAENTADRIANLLEMMVANLSDINFTWDEQRKLDVAASMARLMFADGVERFEVTEIIEGNRYLDGEMTSEAGTLVFFQRSNIFAWKVSNPANPEPAYFRYGPVGAYSNARFCGQQPPVGSIITCNADVYVMGRNGLSPFISSRLNGDILSTKFGDKVVYFAGRMDGITDTDGKPIKEKVLTVDAQQFAAELQQQMLKNLGIDLTIAKANKYAPYDLLEVGPVSPSLIAESIASFNFISFDTTTGRFLFGSQRTPQSMVLYGKTTTAKVDAMVPVGTPELGRIYTSEGVAYIGVDGKLLPFGIAQTTGSSTDIPMSQDAVTKAVEAVRSQLSENLQSETDMRTAADKALQEKADDNAREIGQNRGDIARANTEIAAIKTSIGGIDTKLTKILEA